MIRVSFVLVSLLMALQLSTAQVSAKKLIKEHKKVLKTYINSQDMNGLIFKASGPLSLGEIKADIDIYAMESIMRVETKLLGNTYYQISNDTLVWSYDPLQKLYEFKEPNDEGEGSNSPWFSVDGSELMKSLDLGYKALDVENVKLDSLDAYRMTLQLDSLERFFYFQKSNNYLIGHEWDNTATYYLDHRIFEDRLWPRTYVIKSPEQNVIFNFKEIEKLESLDEELFKMSAEAYKEYVKYLEALNAPPAKSFQEIFDEAEALRVAGKNEEAKNMFDKALALKSDHYGAYNLRGLAKIDLGDQYGAIADFKKSLEIEPKNAVIYSNMGLAKYYLSDYKNAIIDYERAIAMDSTKATFFANLGLVYMDQSNWSKMFEAFDKAIVLEKDELYQYYYRGLANAELENYEAAVADYTKAMQETEFAALSNYRGVSYYYLEKYAEAAKDFEKAATLDPSTLQYPENQGNSMRAQEQYEEAIAVYDQVLEKDSTRSSTYYYRGLAHYELETFEKALNDFLKASDNNSDEALYYDYMAYSKEKLGDLKGAIKDFTQSLNLEQDSNIYYRRGLLKLELKDIEDACRDFSSASELNDDNGRTAFIKHCSQ